MSKEGLTEKLPCETCNQLIPADKLNQHQVNFNSIDFFEIIRLIFLKLNCGSNRTGAEYATIDHDRTRNANQADGNSTQISNFLFT